VCHLNGPASIPLRGRQETDYRPGMPLTDYRIDYRFDGGGEQMTVVGHIEQLRRSVCYQRSPELTCITCHDPHAREKPKDSVAFYRQKCLDCHASRGCKLDRAERLKKDATDNCAGCHMPRGDTDLPHIAFTHHRIGRHSPERTAAAPDRVPELVPTDDVGRVPAVDQKRNLGLAYLAACRNAKYASYVGIFSERARNLLEAVHAAGLRDGESTEALAEIWFYFKKDPSRAAAYARQSVEAKGTPTEVRVMALTLLAACEMQNRDFESAEGRLDELVQLRRFANDWRLLGRCYLEQDQPQKALPALRHALAIRPYRPVIHADLAEAYRRLGDAALAADHLEKAQWLSQHRQD
jgi:tetratricopeptide (TPR) repeat protein